MSKNCTNCRILYAKAAVVEIDRNTQKTTFCYLCLKDREEFKTLLQTKDDTNFSCPEFEQK
jgi:hypothetical protein